MPQPDASGRPIGVFDSGVGGLSVLKALRAELPSEHFVYLSDAGNAPYGERGDAFVVERTRAMTDGLLQEHRVKALVIACNTATAAAIHLLRAEHPALPLVGVEPALKPGAAISRTHRVAVFATRGTLASAKFAALHDSLRGQAEFVPCACDGLAAAIEAGDESTTDALCEKYMAQAGRFGTGPGEIDTLVLGCTHYPFAWSHFASRVAPGVNIVETGAPVARQTRRLLEAAGALRTGHTGTVTFRTTGSAEHLHQAAARWLGV